jgi:hypothetical protein
VWTFDSSARDLRDDGVEGADVTPENWGHHVLAFSRGRFAITQEVAGRACGWLYGTFSVSGRTVAWDVVDGGGYGPQHAINRPGEHYDYAWSRFRDRLELSPVPGRISPFNFKAKPWRRIGGDASAAPFSKRCPPPPVGRQF